MDPIQKDSDLPFRFCSRQFPVHPAFALTINKAQGQTYTRVVLFLPDPMFSHSQPYVAFSRITSSNGIKLLITNKEKEQRQILTTVSKSIPLRNIDFREVFNG